MFEKEPDTTRLDSSTANDVNTAFLHRLGTENSVMQLGAGIAVLAALAVGGASIISYVSKDPKAKAQEIIYGVADAGAAQPVPGLVSPNVPRATATYTSQIPVPPITAVPTATATVAPTATATATQAAESKDPNCQHMDVDSCAVKNSLPVKTQQTLTQVETEFMAKIKPWSSQSQLQPFLARRDNALFGRHIVSNWSAKDNHGVTEYTFKYEYDGK